MSRKVTPGRKHAYKGTREWKDENSNFVTVEDVTYISTQSTQVRPLLASSNSLSVGVMLATTHVTVGLEFLPVLSALRFQCPFVCAEECDGHRLSRELFRSEAMIATLEGYREPLESHEHNLIGNIGHKWPSGSSTPDIASYICIRNPPGVNRRKTLRIAAYQKFQRIYSTLATTPVLCQLIDLLPLQQILQLRRVGYSVSKKKTAAAIFRYKRFAGGTLVFGLPG
ncbi:uncharacterized protein K452DRAFT_305315 [Aplosporella prunicola CBS 121167]|uniref:Uncharacterized protein n=1 Tax=Aplosporella prunicola CBS 121167 TaxID=1176127 RepID=A0A6A6BQU6_9PEZI|nr:uncharacterized protein K452DRAFT_305315 [Aplosporella prunicola CBS 121167]KAF2146380.1 hypothetical protein K452DRAFT_305315 [Aplosporella prunicola CBS 121167]